MRIVPLYLVVIIGMFVVIGIITEFTLQETFRMLMIQFAQWVFIMDPDVNKLDRTRLLICGVQWSLAYEWMFYCALAPIGWIIFKLKQPMSVILFSVGFLIIFLLIIRNNYPGHFWWRLCPFGSGLIAAFIARNEKIRSYFLGWGSSIVILVLGLVSVFIFSSIFSFIPVICITFAFVGIACGNDLFGFLNWTICRQLGQISYSIYLVHGLILFIFFYFVLGFQQSSNFTPLGHWVIICICSIWTVALCCVTYRYIERPGIRAAMSVTSQIRSVLRSKGNSKVPIA